MCCFISINCVPVLGKFGTYCCASVKEEQNLIPLVADSGFRTWEGGEVGHQKLGFWQNPFLVGYFAENARYRTERRLTSLAM